MQVSVQVSVPNIKITKKCVTDLYETTSTSNVLKSCIMSNQPGLNNARFRQVFRMRTILSSSD